MTTLSIIASVYLALYVISKVLEVFCFGDERKPYSPLGWVVGLVTTLPLCWLLWQVAFSEPVPPQVTEEVTVEVVRTEVVEMPNGWVCEVPSPDGNADLLQPSGYWLLDSVDCRKLEVPIEEWCETHPCTQ